MIWCGAKLQTCVSGVWRCLFVCFVPVWRIRLAIRCHECESGDWQRSFRVFMCLKYQKFDSSQPLWPTSVFHFLSNVSYINFVRRSCCFIDQPLYLFVQINSFFLIVLHFLQVFFDTFRRIVAARFVFVLGGKCVELSIDVRGAYIHERQFCDRSHTHMESWREVGISDVLLVWSSFPSRSGTHTCASHTV